VITPEDAIDTFNAAFGRHPGYRALHAKGIFCKGSFTASPEAAGLTRAAHMQGQPVETSVRLSNGTGDPGQPDYAPDVRGMATSFQLPDGSRTDIVAQTSARFPVRTPDEFVKLVAATNAGLSRAWRVPLFLATHPETVRVLPANNASLKPPPSYAACSFYAIHAYRWIDAEGGEHHVRYTWLPEADDSEISKAEARKRGRNYLQEELAERLAREPVRFVLELQIAAADDPVDDPTVAWPSERKTVAAGTLELTGLDPERESGGEVVVFDPARVTDGIELSDDPILRYRPSAYSVSAERRSG
jgi:catalase